MIIGIAGKAGAGKDSIADVLVAQAGYLRLSMADALRAECADALDTCIAPVGCPDDIRLIIECDHWHPDMVYAKPTPASIRRLLQWYGSEYRRSQDPDYWIKRMRSTLKRATLPVVIPDIRFANEAALIREFGGQVWLVRRPTGSALDPQAQSHISERFCDEYTGFDATIDNTGTLDGLQFKVSGLLKHQITLKVSDLRESALVNAGVETQEIHHEQGLY